MQGGELNVVISRRNERIVVERRPTTSSRNVLFLSAHLFFLGGFFPTYNSYMYTYIHIIEDLGKKPFYKEAAYDPEELNRYVYSFALPLQTHSK